VAEVATLGLGNKGNTAVFARFDIASLSQGIRSIHSHGSIGIENLEWSCGDMLPKLIVPARSTTTLNNIF
jgi:hypothetical protein